MGMIWRDPLDDDEHLRRREEEAELEAQWHLLRRRRERQTGRSGVEPTVIRDNREAERASHRDQLRALLERALRHA
jgi:hypothetical protein